jgi:RNA polymerase sigma-54 factor
MVESVLKLVQTFEPLGIGARDDKECLLIQARNRLGQDGLVTRILTDYFEDLEKLDYHAAARDLGVSEKDVVEAERLIKTLQPRPGLAYSSEKLEYVVPDVIVTERDGEWICMLNESDLPRLHIPSSYRDIIRNSKKSPRQDKIFVKTMYRRARWLIGNLFQRRSTILRIARFVTDYQTEFLENGGKCLKPMTMALIAEHVAVHESTVSRAVKGKYVKTPVGMLQFRDWIVNSCNHAVKLRIKELVEDEDKSRPLTDEEISHILSEEGHALQRRTVAKYRKKMNIPPARGRKP